MSKGRLIQTAVIILVALAIIYLFQKEILNLLGDASENVFKDYLERGVIFLSDLFAKLVGIIKSVLSFFADLILKIVGNATELFKLINGILWVLGKLFALIKAFFGFFASLI